MATERASFGSFLFTAPVASSRTRAASLGCTSSTRSPAATSCWASRCPRPAAPSTAQVRSGQAAAHASSRSACAAQARTRSWSQQAPRPRRSPPPCASPYAGPRRSSLPPSICPFPLGFAPDRTAAGMPYSRSVERRTSYEPHRGKVPAGWHVVLKPGHDRSAADMRARPAGTSERYDPNRNAWHRFFNKKSLFVSRSAVGLSPHLVTCPSGAVASPAIHSPWPSSR